MLSYSRWTIWSSILVCVLAAVIALPNVLPQWVRDQMPGWLPKQTLNLGLDLQGGSYLLLEVNVESVYRERLEGTRDEIREVLKKADIGHSGITLQGNDTVVVKVRKPEQIEAAIPIMKSLVMSVESSLLGGGANNYDLTNTPDGTFTFKMTEGAQTYFRTQTLAQSIEIVRRRIDELGTKEPTIQQQGADRILVQVPGVDDPQRLKEVIGRTAKMTFRMVDETGDIQAALDGRSPANSELLYETRDGQKLPLLVEKRVIVTGEQLVNAQQSVDSRNGQPVVSFQFDTQGARRFGDATTENVGRRFAIVLDKDVISAPVINEPIVTGSGQISGSFTFQSANDLAILLRAGALPAELNVVEERTVGAELGADSVAAGSLAAAVGVVLVVVLLIACYGLFGIFAVIGLTLNLIVTVAIMTLLGATLTLPGIAGLILSIGMTVDANVLFYERIREERANGKAAVSSLTSGFSGSMSAIIDANVTQLLACLILFQMGSGPVRGFAVTLGIGIAVSQFTAVLLTRMMVVTWYRWRRPKVLPI
jgi:protein-export membrane protein SecD